MNQPATPLSIVLIVKDAERSLQRCLASTLGFDDVVVLDTGSSDASLEIARGFSHVRVFQDEFVDFSSARNRAAQHARHEWICPLDADECFSEELAGSLRAFRPRDERTVYAFLRQNWFLGRKLHGRQGAGFSRRVYHRQQVRFEGAVHERLVLLDGGTPQAQRLAGVLEHDPFADVGHLFRKQWFYAQPELFGLHRGRHPAVALLRAFWRFLRTLVFDRGFQAGWPGVVLAAAESYGVFLKYTWAYYSARQEPRQ